MDARAPHGHHPSEPTPRSERARGHASFRMRGFTLVEFLVVISIVMLLTGILMPSLARSRDAADRLRCASNLRQVGGALIGFLDDNNNRLPNLTYIFDAVPKYCDGMLLTNYEGEELEGLGRLLPCAPMGGYIADARLLYCPCHHGEHPYDRYASQIGGRLLDTESGTPAYCNYQYKSPLDPATGKQITNAMLSTKVLVADGFRTRSDFNHKNGTNRLFGDCHVDWHADNGNKIYKSLPFSVALEAPVMYKSIWNLIDGDGMER
jgi:prepilin-type processing-associated H-X9-DG protein